MPWFGGTVPCFDSTVVFLLLFCLIWSSPLNTPGLGRAQELQLVFGHMQEGTAKVYDPASFPALLRMDTGSQQDPQVCMWTRLSGTTTSLLLFRLCTMFLFRFFPFGYVSETAVT